MKAMKFKVKDEQHSKEIQEALFAAGYVWVGNESHVQHEDKPVLHAGFFGDNSITYCTSDRAADELGNGKYGCSEYFLFNGQFVEADYFTQPATGKTYEPLPLQPFNQWALDRMKLLAEHISYRLNNSQSVPYEHINELQDLNNILKNAEF